MEIKYEIEVGNSDGKPYIVFEEGDLEDSVRKIAENAIIKGRYSKAHIIMYKEGGIIEEFTK